MRRRSCGLTFLGMGVAVGLVVLASTGAAEVVKVKIGDKMPEFKLTDTTGKAHSLSSYAGKIVVLNFCSQKCPWSLGADPDIVRLATDYKEKGVVFLGIDSHNSTPVDEIKQHVEKAKISYPILKDNENKYADAVNAQRTPELYVIDKEGKLVYHGAFDNRRAPGKQGDVSYLKDALEEALAGKPVTKAEVAAWGCTIKRVPAPRPSKPEPKGQ